MSKKTRKVGSNGKSGATPRRSDTPTAKHNGPWLSDRLHEVSVSIHDLFTNPSHERVTEIHGFILQGLAEIQNTDPIDHWATFHDLQPGAEWVCLAREALISAQTYFTALDDLVRYRDAVQRLDHDPECADEVAAWFVNGEGRHPSRQELPQVLADRIAETEEDIDHHCLAAFVKREIEARADETTRYVERQGRAAEREWRTGRSVF